MPQSVRSPGTLLLVAALLGCSKPPPPVAAHGPVAPIIVSPAPATPPAPPREPAGLLTTLLLEPVAARRMGTVSIEILAPSGEQTFQCSASLAGEELVLPEQWPCGEATGWQRGPGSYTLHLHLRPNWKSNIPDIRRELRVDGDERAFAATLWLGAAPQAPQNPFVRKLTLDRIRPAPATVTLERSWNPAADTSPQYVVHNRSALTLHGIAMWGNFFGRVQVEQAGRWRSHRRGDMCATVSPGEPLAPGARTDSIEGYFIGQTAPFPPGHYRYVLHVALAPWYGGARSDLGDQGLATIEERELFELTDDLVIPAR